MSGKALPCGGVACNALEDHICGDFLGRIVDSSEIAKLLEQYNFEY